LDDVAGITLLAMRRFGLTRSSGAVKRAFDFVGAGLILLVLAPLLATIAVAIKVDSRGPVLFRQRRMGRHGVTFEMLKFRTMVDGAEAQKTALAAQNEAAGGLFKIKDDPRITRVGNRLRQISLDELPQLLNVLRGDMSIVGPRPHALGSTAEDDVFWNIDDRYWQRGAVKPGITGLAQVRGLRGATGTRRDLTDRVQADLEYLANWSVWKDVGIMLQTARVLVHPNAF
jgi:lipopolysaccharide/colanic/teichoic acid biosynthesis glycosyltransferase